MRNSEQRIVRAFQKKMAALDTLLDYIVFLLQCVDSVLGRLPPLANGARTVRQTPGGTRRRYACARRNQCDLCGGGGIARYISRARLDSGTNAY